ncbi:unnamed protein product [Ceutorhynchus assimilis]|uniref:N-acetylmuramoyl-L-alanine amidase domain-containing protein n=1 Tax=Ceutorhynchus assimilis TaxID=467358 RepID=A0A9N9MUZ1_9CUCU|nr:unnamed protein product [Ceutorhynchus assimilis]
MNTTTTTTVNMDNNSATKTEKLTYNKRSLSLDRLIRPMRTNCNECPSCRQIRNITEFSHESTPLLVSNSSLNRHFRIYDTALLIMFAFILISATGIGLYLLLAQDEGAIIEEFDYIARETWGVNGSYVAGAPSLEKPVSKVLLLELFTNCTDAQHCLEYREYNDENKKKIKIFSGQVLYNFYQDKPGRVFEGRGWNYQSDCGQQAGCGNLLTIGVLEEHNVAPSSRQIKKLKAFLDYAITETALQPCYEIIVSHTSARYFDDLAYTLAEMNKRSGGCRYYF